MCEIRVVIEENGNEQPVMENVTKLDVTEDGVAITSLFEGSKEVPQVVIKNIDFLSGKVFLYKK